MKPLGDDDIIGEKGVYQRGLYWEDMGMKLQKNYSFIRGVCYPAPYLLSVEQVKRELGYAQRIQLNSTRIWLVYDKYKEDAEKFKEQLVTYVRTAYEMGFTTMPILFNGNGLNPEILEPAFYEEGDAYVKDIVMALKDEPGIIMWDIMNEPSCNDYIAKSPEDEKEERLEKMWTFLRHYSRLVKALDLENPITIGHTFREDVEPTIEEVDVISFHDYFSTHKEVRGTYEHIKALSEKYQKPMINSEMACLGRANPYDMAIQICEEYQAGWYIFELMIGGYWGDIHGIFYPDGTIRDGSIIAAIMGFYRNRTETAIKPNANKEGYATRGIEMLRAALEEKTEVFHAERKPVEEILEACEFCANLLECCEMVPMYEPPTAKINRFRAQGNPDMIEVRKLAYELAGTLRDYCQLI